MAWIGLGSRRSDICVFYWVFSRGMHQQLVRAVVRRTYFLPWMTFNLWKFEFRIVWIHFAYLFSCRCAQDFDHFNQLINARVTRKDRLSQQQFG